jgi:hypothetical protein
LQNYVVDEIGVKGYDLIWGLAFCSNIFVSDIDTHPAPWLQYAKALVPDFGQFLEVTD